MTTHIKAFTYGPKIPSVRKGTIRQTIRPESTKPKYIVKERDNILFHGWSGRPYWSEWSWRLKVNVLVVQPIIIHPEGINFLPYHIDRIVPWKHRLIDDLARLDGIYPPTGEELGKLLNKFHKLTGGKPFQIIRW